MDVTDRRMAETPELVRHGNGDPHEFKLTLDDLALIYKWQAARTPEAHPAMEARARTGLGVAPVSDERESSESSVVGTPAWAWRCGR
jgi:hypothetical protein